ncbi:hypothetical protein J3458_012350 [Metarhizium acridum]|uniref:uncharacterized protein n=1 Tax=Metarhizium acridum TaxID=92637 RepID=UPI001C6C2AB5|nr:hypothetical protein J3458_012350 [Metarhizium acridum]
MLNLLSTLNIFLKSLPVGVRFNICSFGSRLHFLWPKSVDYTQETLDEAVRHAETFSANHGGTEMFTPARKTFKRRIQESNLEVFLLTDGDIWDQGELSDLINREVAKSKGAIRVAGNGFAQVAGEDEKIDKKVVRMLKGALTLHVSDYTLEIKYDKSEEETAPNTEEDEFEFVERIMGSLTIDAEELPAEVEEPRSGEVKPPISLTPMSRIKVSR